MYTTHTSPHLQQQYTESAPVGQLVQGRVAMAREVQCLRAENSRRIIKSGTVLPVGEALC